MTGTPSQIERAEQIKSRVNAEFDRVRSALLTVARRQDSAGRLHTDAVIDLLEEKRAVVMAMEQAGYFIREWQELTDQVRQMVVQDSRFQTLKRDRGE